MPRKCTICEHPDREKIDKLLVEPSATIRGISRQFAVSDDALSRHLKSGHIKKKILKAAVAQEKIEANDFLMHLQNKRLRFYEMAKEARSAKDPHLELKVYQVESKFTEMEGRALGAFREKIEHSGPGGGPIQLSSLSDEELIAKVKEILKE